MFFFRGVLHFVKISFSQFVSFLSFPLPVLRTQKRDDEIHVKMQEEYKRAQEVERVKEKQRWEESVRYQEQLERQLAEKERRKQEAYEEFLKEKLMIDEIVRKIYEEDQRCVTRCSLLGVKFVLRLLGTAYYCAFRSSVAIPNQSDHNGESGDRKIPLRASENSV